MVGDKVRAVTKITVRIFRFSSKYDRKPLEKFKQGNNFKRIKLKEHTAEEERLGKRCSSLDQGGSMYRCKWSGSGSTLR